MELTQQEQSQRLEELGSRASAALKSIVAWEAELARRLKEEAIRYYKPNRMQDLFHRSKARIRVIQAGNRSGKTHSMIAEFIARMLGYRPWLPKDDPDYWVRDHWMPGAPKCKVPSVGVLIGESFGEQVKKVLIAKLLGDPEQGTPALIPSSEIDIKIGNPKKNQAGIPTHIRLKNASTVNLNSYDQDVELFESIKHEQAGFDEPPPRLLWKAVQRGLVDTNGPTIVAMTPLKEAWFHQEIITGHDEVEVIRGSMRDNVGFGLTKQAVDSFAKTLTPAEYKTRIDGEFFHLEGLVYPNYNKDYHGEHSIYPKVHRVRRHKIPLTSGLYMHIDCHPRKPHHALWMEIAPDGNHYVVGELKNTAPNNLISSFCHACLEYEKSVLQYPSSEVYRLIDPLAKTPNPTGGRTILDEFYEYFDRLVVGSKERDTAIHIVQAKLAYCPDGEPPVYPSIYFFDDLPGIHEQMLYYQWQEWTDKVAQDKDPRPDVKKINDDYVEGVHRIELSNPRAPDPQSRDEDPDGGPTPTSEFSTGI